MRSRGKILIVDDEPINLEFFDVMLSKLGFTVEKAADGEQALRRAVRGADAVINLAAAYCCNALALKLAQSARGKDPNLSETVYLWRSVNRYREMAERLEASYSKQVGGGDGGPPAALASARTTTRPSWRGALAGGYFRDRTVS